MFNNTATGRHRAVSVRTNPLETISKAVSSNAGSMGRSAAVIAAASGLALTAGIPAQSATIERTASTVSVPSRVQVDTVQASSAVQLTFSRPDIKSTPAPEPEPVVETVAQEVAPVVEEAADAAQGAVQKAAPAAAAKPAAAPAKEAAPASASGVASTLVSSAYGQVGISQDCTAMVEKALRAAGKSVGDLAPAQFLSYGTQVSTPQPGDLLYYSDGGAGVAHIAIYVGNGQAVHGGWTGYTTALASADVGSGYVAIRVN
ncbi:NlpC/P60 family protein [Arthrobacter sulfonylureivorans]|uniref:NlpC/P60 family protein n=1 Tax=Arthrobacter sulfonylureivorans TaxID=2486855 RepID=A0ABY3W7Z2_9MICC|nr:NlpC/P60 family protein [Arthrobacter sulfonylureivorans]UNK45365.1 NlpC/P60 family protein [Arthrobacter sulfonylureivorans]